jgi:hypothetical protein
MTLDRNQVLDLWAEGLTAPDIAGRIGCPNWRLVTRAITYARERGDPRATRRPHGKAAPQERPPLRCPELGITATTREVANRGSLATFGPHHARVSVARISCLDDIPRAHSPEIAGGGT